MTDLKFIRPSLWSSRCCGLGYCFVLLESYEIVRIFVDLHSLDVRVVVGIGDVNLKYFVVPK